MNTSTGKQRHLYVRGTNAGVHYRNKTCPLDWLKSQYQIGKEASLEQPDQSFICISMPNAFIKRQINIVAFANKVRTINSLHRLRYRFVRVLIGY